MFDFWKFLFGSEKQPALSTCDTIFAPGKGVTGPHFNSPGGPQVDFPLKTSIGQRIVPIGFDVAVYAAQKLAQAQNDKQAALASYAEAAGIATQTALATLTDDRKKRQVVIPPKKGGKPKRCWIWARTKAKSANPLRRIGIR
jgi:hypothetical protein